MGFISWIFFLPFALQGLAMSVDEFCFHQKRGLPLWERAGHPLDTLSVLICFLYLKRHTTPSAEDLMTYLRLALFSCLLITKDEWIHCHVCTPVEHWIHSVLFLLHPICLALAAWIWWHQWAGNFLIWESGALVAFLTYQIIYWNCIRGTHLPWKKNHEKRIRDDTLEAER